MSEAVDVLGHDRGGLGEEDTDCVTQIKDPGKEDMMKCSCERKEKEKSRGKYTKGIDESRRVTIGRRGKRNNRLHEEIT